jgi:Effector Associated Constant Component 1
VRVDHPAAAEEAMGPSTELVIALAAAATGAAGAVARTLAVWLNTRTSDLTVRVTGRDGRQVSLSAKRVADPEQLLRSVLDHADEDA